MNMFKQLREIIEWNLVLVACTAVGLVLLPIAFPYVLITGYDRDSNIKKVA